MSVPLRRVRPVRRTTASWICQEGTARQERNPGIIGAQKRSRANRLVVIGYLTHTRWRRYGPDRVLRLPLLAARTPTELLRTGRPAAQAPAASQGQGVLLDSSLYDLLMRSWIDLRRAYHPGPAPAGSLRGSPLWPGRVQDPSRGARSTGRGAEGQTEEMERMKS